MLLLRTVHGSRLYGTNHADSDYDYWEVYSNKLPSPAKWTKQTIVNKVDTTQTNLSTFMKQATKGVPQALEAMFSERVEVDEIRDLRHHYRCDTAKVFETYDNTVFACLRNGDTKSLRHAVRLAGNLQQALIYGRFDPTVSEKTRQRMFNSTDEELVNWTKQIMGSL